MITVNGARLQALRMREGFSARDLARQSSMDYAALNRLEADGLTDGCAVTLRQFTELVDALGATPNDLLTIEPPATNDGSSEDDVRSLAALLLDLGQRQPISALADALGWTLERTHAAADTIATLVEPLGFVVHRRSGNIHLKPRDTTHHDVLTRVRKHPRVYYSQRLVTPARARLVMDAAEAPLLPQHLSQSQRKDVGILIHAGILTTDTNGRFIPTADVTLGLNPQIDNQHTPRDRRQTPRRNAEAGRPTKRPTTSTTPKGKRAKMS